MQVHERLHTEDLLKEGVRLAIETLHVGALCENFTVKRTDLMVRVSKLVVHQKFDDSTGNVHFGFRLKYRTKYRVTLITLFKHWQANL